MKHLSTLFNPTRLLMVWIALVCLAAGSLNAATLTFERNAAGDLTGIGINQDKKQVFTYDDSGNLISTVTANVPAAATLSVTVSATTVSLSWPAVSGATGYYLLYAAYPDPGTGGIATIDLGNVTGFSYDLWPGAQLYIAVQAYNNGVTGDISNIETIILN